ncbi:MAG TPA: dihydroorotase, partial [Acidimicrobiales bacterium]|nr:dihydroorotase [Acidimicrobiales bacterium]
MPEVIVVSGGTLVDDAGERRGDLLIEDGSITASAERIVAPRGATIVDATGCIVGPALVDLHTHLREPGGERAETVESGAWAAAAGGYGAIVAMPNTTPPIDGASVVRDVLELGARACVEVAVAGAITIGRLGERLAPFGEMAELGVRIFTDDGRGVQHAGLMRRALEYAGDLGVVLAEHCEDEELSCGGHMHEGAWSSRLGIPAQPGLAEEEMLARDLRLVRLTGSPMHFLHLSTAGSIELIARAKVEGLPVTAEATPHHLCLTDAEVESYDARFKVNPPLRTAADVDAVRRGVADGSIDAIATDHAPHPPEEKDAPFQQAPFGMIGLETSLAVSYGALVTSGPRITVTELFRAMSVRPAKIAGLSHHGGPLVAKAAANIVVFDPAERWVVDATAGASRSTNSPFQGRELEGKVRAT